MTLAGTLAVLTAAALAAPAHAAAAGAAPSGTVDTYTGLNLQEAVATYKGLKARNVPVSMAWQSWGHSGGMKGNSAAAPGELDLSGAHIEDTYLGLRIKNWFDHYLKGVPSAPTGPEFSFFQGLGGLHRDSRAGIRHRIVLSRWGGAKLLPFR